MKRLLVLFTCMLIGSGALFAGIAQADPPPHSNAGGNSADSPGHGNVNSGPPDQGQQQSNGCHGANEVACRTDPQPLRGRDCMHSDDHACGAGVVVPEPPGGGNPNPPGGGNPNPPNGGNPNPPTIGEMNPPAVVAGSTETTPEISIAAENAPTVEFSPSLPAAPAPLAVQPQVTSEVLGVQTARQQVAGQQVQPPRSGDGGLAAQTNSESTLLFLGGLVALTASLLFGIRGKLTR